MELLGLPVEAERATGIGSLLCLSASRTLAAPRPSFSTVSKSGSPEIAPVSSWAVDAGGCKAASVAAVLSLSDMRNGEPCGVHNETGRTKATPDVVKACAVDAASTTNSANRFMRNLCCLGSVRERERVCVCVRYVTGLLLCECRLGSC